MNAEAPPSVKTCSECGRRTDDRSRIAIPSLFHWRRTIPAGLALAALTAFLIWLASSARTGTPGSGSAVAVLIDPPLTRAQLESIASGNSSGGENSLIRAVLRSVREAPAQSPGERHLDVGLVDGEGTRARTASIGWPSAWLWESEYRKFDDAAARTLFRPSFTNSVLHPLGHNEFPQDLESVPLRSRWTFSGTSILYQPPPEETGGAYVTRGLDLAFIVPLAAASIVAWLAVSFIIFIINRLRSRGHAIGGRTIKFATVALAFVAILVAGITSSEEREQFSHGRTLTEQHGRWPGKIYWTRREYSRPGFTIKELIAMERTPGADQMVAQRFLAALDRIPQQHTTQRPRYLSVAADQESMFVNGTSTYTSGLLVLSWMRMQFFRRGDLGSMDLMALPRGISLHESFGYLTITSSSGDPNQFTRRVTIHVTSTCTVIAVSWLFWLLMKVACFGAHRAIVRRRRATGRCAACGYILR